MDSDSSPSRGDVNGARADGGHDAARETVRALIGVWLAESSTGVPEDLSDTSIPPEPTGLAVPHADADTVIRAAHRLATAGRTDQSTWGAPPTEAALIARALVVDEHPSAFVWSASEREQAVEWIAHLIHRQGEDGVQRLVETLRAQE